MQGLLDYSHNEKKRNFVETVELQIGLKSEHTHKSRLSSWIWEG